MHHPYLEAFAQSRRAGHGALHSNLKKHHTPLPRRLSNPSVNDSGYGTMSLGDNLSQYAAYNIDLSSTGIPPQAAANGLLPVTGPLSNYATGNDTYHHRAMYPQATSGNDIPPLHATGVYKVDTYEVDTYQQAAMHSDATTPGDYAPQLYAAATAANGHPIAPGHTGTAAAGIPYDVYSPTTTTSPASSYAPLTPSHTSPHLSFSGPTLPFDTRVGLDYHTLLAHAQQDMGFQEMLLAVAAHIQRERASNDAWRAQSCSTEGYNNLGFAGEAQAYDGAPSSATSEAEYAGPYTTMGTLQADHQASVHAHVANDEAAATSTQPQDMAFGLYQPMPPSPPPFVDNTGYLQAPMPYMQGPSPSTYSALAAASLPVDQEPYHRVAHSAAQQTNLVKPTDAEAGAMLPPQATQQLVPNQVAGPSGQETAAGVQRHGRTDHKSSSAPYKPTYCPAKGCTRASKPFGRPHEMYKHMLCSSKGKTDPAHTVFHTQPEWQARAAKLGLRTNLPCTKCGETFSCKFSLDRHTRKKTCCKEGVNEEQE